MDNVTNIEPASRKERLLKAILENIGGGGGGGDGDETVIEGKLNTFITEENFDEMYSLISHHDIAILYFKVRTSDAGGSMEVSVGTYVAPSPTEGQKNIEAGMCGMTFLGMATVYKSWIKQNNTVSSLYKASVVDYDETPATIADLSAYLDEDVDCRLVLINRGGGDSNE